LARIPLQFSNTLCPPRRTLWHRRFPVKDLREAIGSAPHRNATGALPAHGDEPRPRLKPRFCDRVEALA
jgi:hypothetical protein